MFAKVNNILAAMLVVVTWFLLMKNNIRQYFFNTIMGRFIMIFIIIIITFLNMPLGLIVTIIIIGLHSSRNIQQGTEGFSEGMEEDDSIRAPNLSKSRESFGSMKIGKEAFVKPKSSKTLHFNSLKNDKVPAPSMENVDNFGHANFGSA